jgi:phosphate transport system protein
MTATNDSFQPHTVHRFDDELQAVHGKVVEMGKLVVNQLRLALESLKNRDLPLAQEVIGRVYSVNALETGIDADICGILTKRCPVASDLRVVLAASKVIAHFERVGDKALKLANFVAYQHDSQDQAATQYPLDDIATLASLAIEAALAALDVYERLDGTGVNEVCKLHEVLDQAFQAGLHRLMDFLQAEKADVGIAVSQVLLMKALDRVGDHAESIASLVLYQVNGDQPGHDAPVLARDFPLAYNV